jgi:hypothetical protein
LEKVFSVHNIIPPSGRRRTLDRADVQIRADLNYLETGTVSYSIQRRIPGVSISIPGQWILENCGHEYSDDQVLRNYREGQRKVFILRGEAKIRSQGFALLEKIKTLLHTSTPTALFSVNTLSSGLTRAFPARIKGAQWDDEPQFTVELSEPVPNPIKFGTDVIRKSVTFTDCKGRRDLPRNTTMSFPRFSSDALEHFRHNNIMHPSSRTMFEGPLLNEDDRGNMTAERFISRLREIYDGLEETQNYNKLREEIQD